MKKLMFSVFALVALQVGSVHGAAIPEQTGQAQCLTGFEPMDSGTRAEFIDLLKEFDKKEGSSMGPEHFYFWKNLEAAQKGLTQSEEAQCVVGHLGPLCLTGSEYFVAPETRLVLIDLLKPFIEKNRASISSQHLTYFQNLNSAQQKDSRNR